MLKNFLHIIRWPNLLMIVIVQLIIYIKLLDPLKSVVDPLSFGLLSLVTVIIAASGFVINDYYDAGIDSINRPQRWVAGNIWSLLTVKRIYFVLVSLGGILSLIFAWWVGLLPFVFVYPIVILGLWYYSVALKCKPVVGNLWVSLFCGGAVMIVAVPDLILENTEIIRPELWMYIAFAFLTTWYREVVKDIEDLEGDQKMKCNTFVVRYGAKAGKYMALFFSLLIIALLIWWEVSLINLSISWMLTILQGAVVASMAFVWWARDHSYIQTASLVIKLVMLAGTSMLFFI